MVMWARDTWEQVAVVEMVAVTGYVSGGDAGWSGAGWRVGRAIGGGEDLAQRVLKFQPHSFYPLCKVVSRVSGK